MDSIKLVLVSLLDSFHSDCLLLVLVIVYHIEFHKLKAYLFLILLMLTL